MSEILLKLAQPLITFNNYVMNAIYDNILLTLSSCSYQHYKCSCAPDCQRLQLSRVGGPRGKLDVFYVYSKKTTTRTHNNFAYTDDSLQLA